jgi:hypothetical protein
MKLICIATNETSVYEENLENTCIALDTEEDVVYNIALLLGHRESPNSVTVTFYKSVDDYLAKQNINVNIYAFWHYDCDLSSQFKDFGITDVVYYTIIYDM